MAYLPPRSSSISGSTIAAVRGLHASATPTSPRLDVQLDPTNMSSTLPTSSSFGQAGYRSPFRHGTSLPRRLNSASSASRSGIRNPPPLLRSTSAVLTAWGGAPTPSPRKELTGLKTPQSTGLGSPSIRSFTASSPLATKSAFFG